MLSAFSTMFAHNRGEFTKRALYVINFMQPRRHVRVESQSPLDRNLIEWSNYSWLADVTQK